uniref:Uncharacterized protein n=1 Tax=Marseillevirus sp. TaxID=2809551 RepID=A0AA96ERW9_9VIRU|nr:hypothetical protein MarFTMF_035 [Marseillevirus sp.]
MEDFDTLVTELFRPDGSSLRLKEGRRDGWKYTVEENFLEDKRHGPYSITQRKEDVSFRCCANFNKGELMGEIRISKNNETCYFKFDGFLPVKVENDSGETSFISFKTCTLFLNEKEYSQVGVCHANIDVGTLHFFAARLGRCL